MFSIVICYIRGNIESSWILFEYIYKIIAVRSLNNSNLRLHFQKIAQVTAAAGSYLF